MTYEQIRYERRDAVGIITLHRPEKRNARTPRMSVEQADAIERANADDAVGAIVMTGAGLGFCAGADMQDTFQTRIDGTDPGGDTAAGQGGMPKDLDWVALCRRSKPLVAAVNPPPQLRMIKQLLSENGADTDLSEVQRRETRLLRECWKTPEHAEAVRAFLEKRPPKFR